ncbi:MAG: VTT domain-containing protein [Anaerovoracaceae bacterium]|nr:VTT domain-containing protein [Bacillota bacterium]MDY2670241.1 VTT domain-containing protein [Anaerovoracaceae bacterium]
MKIPEIKITKETVDEWKGAVRALLVDLLVFIGVTLLIGLFFYLKYPGFFDNFRSVDAFNAFMEAHHDDNIIIYTAVQALQTVVSFIPGQVVQIAGGYMFGFWMSSLLSLIGIAIGSSAAFAIARVFGLRPVKLLCGENACRKCEELLNHKAAYRTMALLYIIPGFPKDLLAYVAGMSEMSYFSFLPLCTVFRFPAMAASMLIGAFLAADNIIGAVTVVLICAALFIACVVWRRNLKDMTDRFFSGTGSRGTDDTAEITNDKKNKAD